MYVTYRESAAPDPIWFTDEQRRWIAATTTEEKVRTNLTGRDAHPFAIRPRDGAGQVLLWTGLAFTGLGGIAAFATASMLSAVAIVPGILVAGAAVHRLQQTESGPFSIDVIVVAPKFEARTVDGKTQTYLVTEGSEPLVWPRPLLALSSQLAETTMLRVGIVRRKAVRYISWAFPI